MYKSLYPSIMGEFNVAPNTQIGRIEIPNKVYEHENAYFIEEEKYSRGGEFIENMVTDNMIEYCHRWFHLGNILEVLDDIDEFYNKSSNYGQYSNLIQSGFGNAISPIYPIASRTISPIEFGTPKKAIAPIVFNLQRPENLNYENIINGE